MIKRILVGLAGTPYTPAAIQRAIMIAKAHSAEVTGVAVLDLSRVRRPSEQAASCSRRLLPIPRLPRGMPNHSRPSQGLVA